LQAVNTKYKGKAIVHMSPAQDLQVNQATDLNFMTMNLVTKLKMESFQLT